VWWTQCTIHDIADERPWHAVFRRYRELRLVLDRVVKESVIHREDTLLIGVPDTLSTGVYRSMRLAKKSDVRVATWF
jgi:hypothetical protein